MRGFLTYLMLISSCGLAAASEPSGPLVTTEWLAAHQTEAKVVDVRKNETNFAAEGHIPGSLLVLGSTIRTTRVEGGVKLAYMIPTADEFSKIMRDAGVNKDDFIVITHAGKTWDDVSMAARLYWQLKYFGHGRVALLDGGVLKWKDEGRPIERELSLPDEGTFEAANERKEILATTLDVELAIASGGVQLADTRSL